MISKRERPKLRITVVAKKAQCTSVEITKNFKGHARSELVLHVVAFRVNSLAPELFLPRSIGKSDPLVQSLFRAEFTGTGLTLYLTC